MQPDLLIRQANLPEGGAPVDIAIADGTIVEIAQRIAGNAPLTLRSVKSWLRRRRS